MQHALLHHQFTRLSSCKQHFQMCRHESIPQPAMKRRRTEKPALLPQRLQHACDTLQRLPGEAALRGRTDPTRPPRHGCITRHSAQAPPTHHPSAQARSPRVRIASGWAVGPAGERGFLRCSRCTLPQGRYGETAAGADRAGRRGAGTGGAGTDRRGPALLPPLLTEGLEAAELRGAQGAERGRGRPSLKSPCLGPCPCPRPPAPPCSPHFPSPGRQRHHTHVIPAIPGCRPACPSLSVSGRDGEAMGRREFAACAEG